MMREQISKFGSTRYYQEDNTNSVYRWADKTVDVCLGGFSKVDIEEMAALFNKKLVKCDTVQYFEFQRSRDKCKVRIYGAK